MALNDEMPEYSDDDRGYVQPYDALVDEMVDYIDRYATEEPSVEARRKMLSDAQVKSVSELLKEAVLSTGWNFNYDFEEDKEKGEEMVKFLYKNLNKVNLQPWSAGGVDDLISKWMDALFFKKMVCELVYEHENGEIIVKKGKVLPPESIKLSCDRFGNLINVRQFPHSIEVDDMTGGFRIEERGDPVDLDMDNLIIWVNGDDYGRFKGKSELDCVYKYWFLKDFILKFWSIYIERFGAPLLIAFVRAKNMGNAKKAMKNIITDTSFTMEHQDKVEMFEPHGEGQTFRMMIDYCDSQITKGLLVPTLMLGGDNEKGSGSLGEVQYRMFEYRVNYIRRKLENLMSALIKKVIDLNYSDVLHYPTFSFKAFTITNRVKMAQTFDLLVKNSMVHPLENWVRKELQLPEVDDEHKECLRTAWEAKMTVGSGVQFPNDETPSPTADIKRPEAQTNQREPDGGEFSDGRKEQLKKQLEKADEKFERMLTPSLTKSLKSLISKVRGKLEEEKELAEMPDWLKNLEFDISHIRNGTNELIDELMVDVTLEDNQHLTQLGMETAFDIQTRTGAFDWIDQQMADIRAGLLDYGSDNINKLELRILEDTKKIVQSGLNQGLRTRDIVDNLEQGMLGERYSKAQLKTVVRTNTTAVINNAKIGFARANVPFVKGMSFLAVIDDRTTQLCEELHERNFAIDDPQLDRYTPPLHFNCRSMLDYVIEGQPQFDAEGITQEVPVGFGGDI